MPTNEELAYFAGVIDGEGTVSLGVEHAISAHVSIANTNVLLLEFLQARFGGTIGKKYRANPKHKPLYHLSFKRDEIVSWISEVIRFLVIKQEQASLVQLYLSYPSRRMRKHDSAGRFLPSLGHDDIIFMYRRIQQLNRRGMTID